MLSRLSGVVGEGALLSDPDQLMVYESDGLTQYRFAPGAVVLPGSMKELQEVVRILHLAERPFVPRGAGTGLSGGALALNGAVVVATTRMNRILELDPENRRARVEPGVINAHLTRAAAPHGLYYAPDPSSQSACTLGGNVAENSGGPHCLKYGVTSRYVRSLQVVLPSGELVGLGRGEAGGALDLAGLFVGSEGCFGVAAEVEVDLLPVPEGIRTLLAIFDSLEEAGQAVSGIIGAGLLPAALEIMDQETIRAVEDSIFAAGYPRDAGAALVVEFDGVEAGLDGEVEAARERCRDAGATRIRTAASPADREALWKGRKKAFGAMGRIAPDLLVQDATVPRTRLPEVLARIGEIGRRHELRVANVFHAGDGNLHPNLLFDRNDPDELARVEAASQEMMEVCIQAGGTITGEHGVGLDKRRYLPRVVSPPVLEAMAGVKAAFDPAGRCNPGKVLPDGVLPAGEPSLPEPTLPEPVRPGGSVAGGPHSQGDEGDREAIRRQVVGLLGDEGCASPEGGSGPLVVSPASPEEAGAFLVLAAEKGWPIWPTGRGGAMGDRKGVAGEARDQITDSPPGGSPSGAGTPPLLLSTRRLKQILHYEPADLTLEVEAGLSLGELDRALAAQGQWLPLDPPGNPDAPLGSVIARGLPGPLVAGFGHPRDHLLGMTVVDGRGKVLKLGGRVVKNVAGFDLLRLLCGSQGALGFIVALALRLHPRPEADRTLVWHCPGLEEGLALGHRLRKMPFPVASLELVRDDVMGEAGNPRGTQVLLRVVGGGAVVDRVARAAAELGGEPEATHEGDASAGFWQGRALEEGREEGRGEVVRVPVKPTEVGGVLASPGWGPDGEGRRAGGAFAVHLTTGVVRLPAPEVGHEDGRGGQSGDGGGGSRPLLPPGMVKKLDEPARELTGRLRRVFDPTGIFPGRWGRDGDG